MPFIRQSPLSHTGFRRTLREGDIFDFQPGQVLEVTDSVLTELLERCPGVLEQVKPERRGASKEVRRWRPVVEATAEAPKQSGPPPDKPRRRVRG